jgi:hypothetical protein
LRTILTKIPIIMVILYIAGCANQSPAINSKDKWIFAHMATHAQISNNTTLVIPLTQDIIAFTQYPYQKQAAFTGLEFTSFLENENKTGTRHAVLSWLNGEKIEQVTLIVKDIVQTLLGLCVASGNWYLHIYTWIDIKLRETRSHMSIDILIQTITLGNKQSMRRVIECLLERNNKVPFRFLALKDTKR